MPTSHQNSMVIGHNNDTHLTVYTGTELLLQVKFTMASRPGHCGVGISAKYNTYSLAAKRAFSSLADLSPPIDRLALNSNDR